MKFDIHSVFFTNTGEEVAGDPDLVGCGLSSFSENLVFPLTLRHFGVDAFVVDPGGDTDVEVLFHDGAGKVTHSG